MRVARVRMALFLALVAALALPAIAAEQGGGLELKSVRYESRLSWDPFDLPDFDAVAALPTDRLNLLAATLVGLVRIPGGIIALVEDENGESYSLMKGDPVLGGRVTDISAETLLARVRINGVQQRIRMELAKEGD